MNTQEKHPDVLLPSVLFFKIVLDLSISFFMYI